MAGSQGGLPRGALGAWWGQGLRTALFMRPDWSGLPVTPAVVACLFLVSAIAGILLERLYIDGPALFYWPSLGMGWMSSLVVMWMCWLLVRGRSDEGAAQPRDAAALFAMLSAQSLSLLIVLSLVLVPMARAGRTTRPRISVTGSRARPGWRAFRGSSLRRRCCCGVPLWRAPPCA
jgi:hypothetical protein